MDVDVATEKDIRNIDPEYPFYDAPFVVIDAGYEYDCAHDKSYVKGVTQYGHKMWAVWEGLVYECHADDPTIDLICDHRNKEKKPILVGTEKPYTMPNGERSRQTQPKDR